MEQPEYYIDEDNDTIWYLPSKGKEYWHRPDGPAVERMDGSVEWWFNNKRHCLNGPAFDYVHGRKEWWVNDFLLDKRKVEAWLIENNVDLRTPEGQMAFKLAWT